MENRRFKITDLIFGTLGLLITVYALWPKGISYTNEGIYALALYGLLIALNFFVFGFISRRWAKVIKLVMGILCAVAALIYIIFAVVMYATPVDAGEGQNGTVIVMGAKAIGNEPSGALEERLEVAADYLNKHTGSYCIVSGGQGEDEDYSEATVMKKYLIDSGINRSRIIMEEKSKNTKESIKMCGDIIKTGSYNENMIICTNGYHQYRCGIYCDQYQFANYALSVPFNIKTDPVYIMREIMAIVYDFLLR